MADVSRCVIALKKVLSKSGPPELFENHQDREFANLSSSYTLRNDERRVRANSRRLRVNDAIAEQR